jgi:hypothetical protein
MTAAKYAAYEASVEHNLKHLDFVSTGACRGCRECGLKEVCNDQELDAASEPYFSRSDCEACGSILAGDRHPVHGKRIDDHSLEHLAVCTDCMYYITYGQLDDETMMEIEKSKNHESTK